MISPMVRVAAAAFCFALIVGFVSPVAAQFYRWTDDQGNAYYTEGLYNVPERYRSKAVPLGLRNAPPPPPGSPAAQPEKSTPGGATIRFTPGERIMVDAKINGKSLVRLLLDTGADKTLISPKALSTAGVSMLGAVTGSVTGVAGQAQAQGVAVDSLEVQEARVTGLQVISFEMDKPGVDGLLGRDFLERFNVNIDSANGLVTLRPK